MGGLDSSILKNKCQLYGLVTLRVLIGWHFLYEGIAKLLNPYWSSAAFLFDAKWLSKAGAASRVEVLQEAYDSLVASGIATYFGWNLEAAETAVARDPDIIKRLAESIVSDPTTLTVVDQLNMWGLTIIGCALMLGLLSRWASIAGLVLILIYYMFAPPFLGLEYSKPGEGSYIIVNKNLIEACALWVIYSIPTSHVIGLDRFLSNPKSN